jgi:hypothetical protein
MRLRDGETVSALAPVVESEEQKNGNGDDETEAHIAAPDEPEPNG